MSNLVVATVVHMADVGISIIGQEGRQAVMASEFAMGQFRFLVPLLLVHGHWNYQRTVRLIGCHYTEVSFDGGYEGCERLVLCKFGCGPLLGG
ncbi:hypothetical protein IFM89_000565 [Coptis chinensis]|uniref:P-type ATPase C-terminal domain-containing protein n=1 Tax=Coptis chinensis TaxID=261450 RepID=A0A835IKJ7_9MAGN|nr:hypothetical protein IFM89_000565 [Coptis chinensis]